MALSVSVFAYCLDSLSHIDVEFQLQKYISSLFFLHDEDALTPQFCCLR